MLSKGPELRTLGASNLRQVQELFWMDVQDTFSKRVKTAGTREPPGCCEAVRVEAATLVEEWLRHTEIVQTPAPQPTRPSESPMAATSTSEGLPLAAPPSLAGH